MEEISPRSTQGPNCKAFALWMGHGISGYGPLISFTAFYLHTYSLASVNTKKKESEVILFFFK